MGDQLAFDIDAMIHSVDVQMAPGWHGAPYTSTPTTTPPLTLTPRSTAGSTNTAASVPSRIATCGTPDSTAGPRRTAGSTNSPCAAPTYVAAASRPVTAAAASPSETSSTKSFAPPVTGTLSTPMRTRPSRPDTTTHGRAGVNCRSLPRPSNLTVAE